MSDEEIGEIELSDQDAQEMLEHGMAEIRDGELWLTPKGEQWLLEALEEMAAERAAKDSGDAE